MAEVEKKDAVVRLKEAAAGGETSVVESIVTAIAADQGPVEADSAAQTAIKVAVEAARWETASYLADFLANTERSGVMEGAGPASEETEDGEDGIFAAVVDKAERDR